MEVEVALPPPTDFNFDSNCSSPYITAPSSPQRFGNSFFFSAPASPTRVSTFFPQFNDHARHSSASSVPSQFDPKSEATNNASNDNKHGNEDDEDFEFDFSGHLQRPSLSADELFDGGKIRPLKLNSLESNASKGKKLVQESPMEETHKREQKEEERVAKERQQKRGRERVSSLSTSSGRKGTRSCSPLRDSLSEDFSQTGKGHSSSTSNSKSSATSSSYASFLSSISFTKGYRKWRLKDFLLFRSASEGRATDKDPLRKYSVLAKTTSEEDVRNSSFRSTESTGSVSRRRGPVSAHELHYTVNRAASEEMKKKTLLPYKQGLLGCLGFNHGMHHISRGIGSFARS